MTRQLKVGICGRMFPPAQDAIASIPRVEALGWDFINYPDQLSGTHPTGMLQTPALAGDPSAPSGMYSDIWLGSFEMCTAAAVLTERLEIMLAVVDPLRRSPALMAQEMATLNHLFDSVEIGLSVLRPGREGLFANWFATENSELRHSGYG